jgi:hypothetical protein
VARPAAACASYCQMADAVAYLVRKTGVMANDA